MKKMKEMEEEQKKKKRRRAVIYLVFSPILGNPKLETHPDYPTNLIPATWAATTSCHVLLLSHFTLSSDWSPLVFVIVFQC